MSMQKMLAIVFIGAGIMGLIYGGFSFTKETHEAELGPLSMTIDEKEYVSVPVWAGIASIVIGTGLLLMRKQS
ncbi:MAG: hypothetical protein Q7V56_10450 [Gammaproteobacteria bacterium]|nr:hypothetical protein [Gammaproteobacteria bacterium]